MTCKHEISPFEHLFSFSLVFEPCVEAGERVYGGDIIGYVQETDVVRHKIMLAPGIGGIIKEITGGTCTVEDVVAIVLD